MVIMKIFLNFTFSFSGFCASPQQYWSCTCSIKDISEHTNQTENKIWVAHKLVWVGSIDKNEDCWSISVTVLTRAILPYHHCRQQVQTSRDCSGQLRSNPGNHNVLYILQLSEDNCKAIVGYSRFTTVFHYISTVAKLTTLSPFYWLE